MDYERAEFPENYFATLQIFKLISRIRCSSKYGKLPCEIVVAMLHAKSSATIGERPVITEMKFAFAYFGPRFDQQLFALPHRAAAHLHSANRVDAFLSSGLHLENIENGAAIRVARNHRVNQFRIVVIELQERAR